MRDASRIPMILAELQRMWLKNPDLRLGQLILGAGSEKKVWNMEDVPLIQALQSIHDRDILNEKPS